jgi:hypothetical protein
MRLHSNFFRWGDVFGLGRLSFGEDWLLGCCFVSKLYWRLLGAGNPGYALKAPGCWILRKSKLCQEAHLIFPIFWNDASMKSANA